MPTLTLGMATFDDVDGVLMTIMPARIFLGDVIDQFVIVDNGVGDPRCKEGCEYLKTFLADCNDPRIKYVEFDGPPGTTQPRNAVFANSDSDFTVCCDSHVITHPEALPRLKQYYTDHPTSKDLISGPLWYNDLNNRSECWDDVWAEQMRGQWHHVSREEQPDDVFEIEAQGLGLFACRTDAWPGFNPNFMGFGGEEIYIHKKFRRLGRKCLCARWLLWWHRFGKVGGVKYTTTIEAKTRNCVLGENENEEDHLRTRDHVVGGGFMSRQEWDKLVADPLGYAPGMAFGAQINSIPSVAANRPQPDASTTSLDDLFDWGKTAKRDLDQHFDKLRELASQADRVLELGKRRESTLALVAGRPESMISYNLEPDVLYERIHAAVASENAETGANRSLRVTLGDSLEVEPVEADLLFIDTVHRADRVYSELRAFAPLISKRIALRGTGMFGEVAEGSNDPGLMVGVRQFMMENPIWHLTYQTDVQYGLTVISRDSEDPDIDAGVGTEFKNLTSLLRLSIRTDCKCLELLKWLNALGIQGVEDNYDEALSRIRENAKNYKWTDVLKAGYNAVRSGIAFEINPADPYPGLLDLAIKNAKEKENVR